MLLTASVAAITGGALYRGTKIYREKKKKRETPWTYYAERLSIKDKQKKRRPSPFMIKTGRVERGKLKLLSVADSAQLFVNRGTSFTKSGIFSDTRRHEQLKEMSSADGEVEISESEERTNRYLGVSLTSLGFASAGALLYPPLSLISAASLVYVSVPFSQDAYKSLVEEKKVNIGVLDTVLAGMCIATGHYFAWSLACSFIYGGRKILSKTEDHSRKSLLNVFGQQSRFVCIHKDGVEVEVPLATLQVGDIIVVTAGETIPVDGIITVGMASIDQHILTGESQPTEKEVGDQVFASTVILSGRIDIRVEKTGEETTTAKIAEILTHTADFKSSVQSRGELYADRSALPTLGFASLALLTTGPVAAIAILNACFGFHLRVLAPVSMLSFLNLASQNGILIKDGRVLDLLTQVDTIVFDKTGTLTHEQPHVGQTHTCSDYSANEVLTYAAAAEYRQTHPIARAILEEAKAQRLVIPQIDETNVKVGYGLTVRLDDGDASQGDKIIRVGSTRFMELEEISIPLQIRQTQEACHHKGHSLVMVAVNNKLVGAIELLPTVRPEAKEIIEQLRARNKSMYIISGDHETPTKRLAEELGISNYFAETLPENKADLIAKLQEEGKFVCYVGDGINDSIALKKAQVSISLRGASTIATDTAQVILMDNSLNQVVQLFDLAQDFDASMKTMLVATMVPGFITVSGAFFWHFGLIHSIILNQSGFATGFSSAVLPLIKHQRSKETTR